MDEEEESKNPFLLLNFALLLGLEIKSDETLMYFWSFLLYFMFFFCKRRYSVGVRLPVYIIKFQYRLKQPVHYAVTV